MRKERKTVKSLSRVRLFATPWTVAYQLERWLSGLQDQTQISGLEVSPIMYWDIFSGPYIVFFSKTAISKPENNSYGEIKNKLWLLELYYKWG